MDLPPNEGLINATELIVLEIINVVMSSKVGGDVQFDKLDKAFGT